MSSPLEPSSTWKWPNFCQRNNSNNSNNSNLVSSGGVYSTSFASPSANTSSFMSEFDDVANSFANLTVKEKESAFDDIHGCTDDTSKKDPQLIEKRLIELDVELQKKSREVSGIQSSFAAYREAYEQNRSYVEDRNFRLLFLYADSFNVKDASNRIFQFFEQKLNLFGIEKLARPITYDDLSNEDLECLHSGDFQMLPLKDRTGRNVVVGLNPVHHDKTLPNHLRAHFYFFMKLLDVCDETLITKGYVGIIFDMRENSIPSRTQLWHNTRLRRALPLRMSAVHVCYRSNTMRPLLTTMARLTPKRWLFRLKLHFGSLTECAYALMGFGIPASALPIKEVTTNGSDNGGRQSGAYRYFTHQHSGLIEKMKQFDNRISQQREEQQHQNQNQQLFRQNKNNDNANENANISELLMAPIGNADEGWDEDISIGDGSLLSLADIMDTIGDVFHIENDDNNDNKNDTANDDGGGDMKLNQDENEITRTRTNGAAVSEAIVSSTLLLPHEALNGMDTDNQNETVPKRDELQSNTNISNTSQSTTVDAPRPVTYLRSNDVILGRGKPVNRFPGNKHYRQMILSRVDIYEISNKLQKTKLTAAIVDTVKARGGRFVRKINSSPTTGQEVEEMIKSLNKSNNGEKGEGAGGTETDAAAVAVAVAAPGTGIGVEELIWEEVDDVTARLKVASGFRSIRKSKKKS